MKFSQPTPELAVPDVQAAQEYYHDKFGFEIGWCNAAGRIGAVSHGDCAIFFRECTEIRPPSTFWVFCPALDEAHAEFLQRGADVVDSPENKPWGLRQFTIRDHCGNLFHFFHD
ncbi:MAG: VOC family protein [Pseudomonadota bacterium]